MSTVQCKSGEIYVSYVRKNGTFVEYCRKDVGAPGKTPQSKKKIVIKHPQKLTKIFFPDLPPYEVKGKFTTITEKQCYNVGNRYAHQLFGKKLQKEEMAKFREELNGVKKSFGALIAFNTRKNPNFRNRMEMCRDAFVRGYSTILKK